MAFAIRQLEQDVEHERLEREKAIDTLAVLGHGPPYCRFDTNVN
jgi:hypothetical protein